jgi:deoxyribose-phosphate aldolase
VIIEAALLTDDEKITACTLAKAAGADYVKTRPASARRCDRGGRRPDAAVVGAEMGVKAAGGVRDLEGMKAMIAAAPRASAPARASRSSTGARRADDFILSERLLIVAGTCRRMTDGRRLIYDWPGNGETDVAGLLPPGGCVWLI